LLRSGFHTLRLGLETADDDTGPSGDQQVDPKTSYREFAQAAAYLREAGFAKQQLGAYLLVGLPGQSLKDVRRAISAVHRQGVTPIPAYYSPIPHTALWSRAVAVSRYDLAADPIFSNNAVFPCWDDGFSWKTLEQIRGWVRGTP
ncbi:MAG: B12-binding domain-containing radical SAM protein, partial [Desulfobacterales bacterium]